MIQQLLLLENGENDVEMLKEADIGVGVGNIPNSLSKYADIYLEYNGGTSILEFLEKYFYERRD